MAMKHCYYILLSAICAVALFSCQKETEVPDMSDDGIVPSGYVLEKLTAVSDQTKTTVDNGVTLWSADDQIKVICSDGSASNFTIQSGAGTNTGDFQGLVPEGKTAVYAVYPAANYASVSGSTVKVNIPASQTGVFGAGNLAVAKVDSDDHSMAFKNVNAFISFTIPATITKVVISSVSGADLVGTLSVSCSGDDPTAGAVENGASSVTTTFPNANGGTYYISVAPGVNHPKGLLMTYYKGEAVSGTYYLNKNITTAANSNITMGAVETEGNYYVTVSGAGNHTGMDWSNAFSASEMWKRLSLNAAQQLDPEAEGADPESKEAKIAAINGATFHMGAGEYDFAADPTIRLNEGASEPIVLHFKGGYPAAGGTQDLSLYRADIVGDNNHHALRLRGVLTVSFEGIGFTKGKISADNRGTLDLNASGEGTTLNVSMSYCYVGNNKNTSIDDDTHENHNQGAGLYLYSVSSFTADHVTFENNSAYAAAGVFVRECSPVFTNCTFSNNVAYNKAAAVYTTGTSDATVAASFTGCTFSNNESLAYQGAALQQNKGTNTFTNCTFTNNVSVDSAASGTDVGYGGAINVSSGDLTITGGTFSGNEGIWGGAIMYGADGKTLSISGTTFSGNSATKDGGALELGKGSVELTNCTFTGNEALHDDIARTSGDGYGGAVDCYSATNLSVSGGSFSGNVAWRGGAMNINTTGSVSLTGVTFTANGSSDYTRAGGAIYGKKNWTITNCTFGGANATDANKAKFGGAINHVKHDGNFGVVTLKGGVFRNNVALECGGAICEESSMKIERSSGVGTLFQDNKVTAETAVDCGGGAIWAETYSTSSNKNVKVTGAVFKGNEAFSGGACLVYGNSSGLYLTECTFGGENSGDGNYARGNSGDGGGGSLYMDKKSYSTFTRCTITGDHAKRYGGSVYAHTNGGNFIAEGCTFTDCYSSGGWGGAINTFKGKMDKVEIKGCSFIGCHSDCGGAVLCRISEGKFIITDYNNTGCLFQGNYANHATSVYQGGAVQLEGAATVTDGVSSLRVTIWKARFIGNYAGQGGAIYAKSTGKPDVYIDRCSFDGNYITKKWGPVIATDGVNRFQMNNCTIRNSYTTNTSAENQTDLKPSWVAIDGLPADGLVTISNTTIIGDPQYSADGSSFTPLPTGNGLVAIWGSQPNYLINNIIVPNTASVASVRGTGSETVNLRYNQLGTVASIAETDLGGNVKNLKASNIGSLSWTDNCWQWNGKINGNTPAMTTATDVLDRLNAVNAAFVTWIAEPDDHYDYYGVNRGDGSWWPGAYQAAN